MDQLQDISVSILDEGARAELHIPAGYQTEHITHEFLCSVAGDARVIVTSEVSARLKAIAEAYAAHPEEMVCEFASAHPPVHGRDGSWTWATGLEGASSSSGRSVATENSQPSDVFVQPHVLSVVAGHTVATFTAPTEGVDGQNVLGTVMQAKRGRSAPIRAGAGLELRADGSVVAKMNGVLRTVAGVASVSNVLNIAGNVDLGTGHIQFQGDVNVAGNVCDGYKLHATGHVTVGGSVEGAEIVCAGELSCPRGVASARRARIAVGSGATVGFMRNTVAIIRGTMRCRGEVEHCEITLYGDCECEQGRVIGGTLVLSNKSQIGTIGSPNWIPTRVCVGGLPTVAAQLGRLNIEYSKLQKVILAKEEALLQLQAAAGTLNATMREKLTELQYEVSELSRDAGLIDAERAKLQVITQKNRKCELLVTELVYPKVRIQHGEAAFEFNKELRGPVRFLIDERGDIMVRVSTSAPVSILKYAHTVKAVMTLSEGGEQAKKCA